MGSIEDYDDIGTKNQYTAALADGVSAEDALNACFHKSRDNARTPMQWCSSVNSGFTSGKPWLKVNPNYTEINVAEQTGRADSVLNYYRRLIALHKSDRWKEVFTEGRFAPAYQDQPSVFAYYRKVGDTCVLVAANFGVDSVTLPLIAPAEELLLKNMEAVKSIGTNLLLPSCSSAVIAF
jgi:oligo-1,6-glucosidase